MLTRPASIDLTARLAKDRTKDAAVFGRTGPAFDEVELRFLLPARCSAALLRLRKASMLG